jgi:hypothetical protein
MSDWNILFSDKAQMAVAGALGGVVRWLTLRSNVADGIVSIVVGAICAIYLGPVSLPLIEPVLGKIVLDANARAGLSGFLIGIGGIGVSSFLMELWQRRREIVHAPVIGPTKEND